MAKNRTAAVTALWPAEVNLPAGQSPSETTQDPDGHAAVVSAACQGDHGAFTRLVGVYDERLRVLAYGLLGTRQAMDDVLQDAYLSAYRSLRRFRGEADIGTWLHRIVYNQCLQHLRRRRPADLEPEETLARYPARGLDVDDEVALRDQLRRALAQLSPTHRAAVLLVHHEGLSYADAAEVLGVPVGTVASRVAAARSTLAAALERSNDEREER